MIVGILTGALAPLAANPPLSAIVDLKGGVSEQLGVVAPGENDASSGLGAAPSMMNRLTLAGFCWLLVLGATVAAWRQDSAALRGLVVDAKNGTAISGAVVTLGRLDGAAASHRKVVTSPDGTFHTQKLPPGDYLITVAKTGYLTESLGSDPLQKPISLQVGQTRSDLIISLIKYGAIVGKVESDGRPSARVLTYALEVVSTRGVPKLSVVQNAYTDEHGIYTLNRLPPGRYIVAIAAVDEERGFYPITYYPGVRLPSQSNPVELAIAEERVGVNFSRQKGTGLSLSGHISAAAGGMPGFITATPVEFVPGSVSPLEVVKTAVDSDGLFKFTKLLAGRYMIQTVKFPDWDTPGLRLTGRPGTIPRDRALSVPRAGPTQWLNETLELSESVSDVRFQMAEGYRVSGKIVLSKPTTMPRPDDLGRQPIGFESIEGPAIPDMPLTLTDSSGNFLSVGMPRGRYVLRPRSVIPGWQVSSVRHQGREISDGSFLLDREFSDIVVTFTDRPNDISGTVRDDRGMASRALVLLVPASVYKGAEPYELSRIVISSSDGIGHFKLQPFPGDYRLMAVSGIAPTDVYSMRFLQSMMPASIGVKVAEGSVQVRDLVVKAVK